MHKLKKIGENLGSFANFLYLCHPKSKMITHDNDEKTIIHPVDVLTTLGTGSDE